LISKFKQGTKILLEYSKHGADRQSAFLPARTKPTLKKAGATVFRYVELQNQNNN